MKPDDCFVVVLVLGLVWGALISRLEERSSRELACALPGLLLVGLFGGLWHAPLSSACLYYLLQRLPARFAPLASIALAFGLQLVLRTMSTQVMALHFIRIH
ncbi:hypothetical protein T492DRAFT_874946 [Pavlovales sp. CCMP2436]|nr:hypothetical protein T492DRAFT_874946 [Pavlovales sp. CCMP2436]